MHPATSTPSPSSLPCIRDYSELITKVIPEPVYTLVPMEELERRGAEVVRIHPRFAQEMPVLIKGEKKRRAALAGPQLSK